MSTHPPIRAFASRRAALAIGGMVGVRHKRTSAAAWKACRSLVVVALAALMVNSALGADDAYVIRRWTTADGLPQVGVRALTQTRDGYLWIGTFRGLARFDGLKFAAFSVGNVPELATDYIHALHADSSGGLWVGTFENDALLVEGGRFWILEPASRNVSRSVEKFTTDELGRTFGLANGKLALIEAGRILGSRERAWLPDVPVSDLAADPRGGIWAACPEQLIRIVGESWEPVHFQEYPRRTQFIAVANDGTLWAANSAGVFFAHNGGFERHPGVPDVAVRGMLPGGNGVLWLATQQGLYRVEGRDVRSFALTEGSNQPNVIGLVKDRQGNLWVGSEDKGLFCLSPRRVTAFALGARGLSAHGINTFMEDDAGQAVMASAGGLFRFSSGRFEALGPVASAGRFEAAALTRGNDGRWWIGSYGQGIYRGQPGRWERYIDAEVTENFWTDTFHTDPDGSIWISGSKRVLRHHAGQTVRHRPEEPAMARVHAIIRDRQGALWFGTHGEGLLREAGGALRRWRRADGLGTDTVHGFCEDHAGRLWIGTSGGGLALVQGDELRRWTTADGLLGNVVLQLHEDAAGHLWLGTEAGISRIDPRELLAQSGGKIQRVHSFRLGQADGAPADQCEFTTSPAGLRQRDGRIWFSMFNGLAVVDPSQIHPEASPPDVVIEAMLANGAEAPLSRTGTGKESAATARLGAGLDRLEIHYTGFEFIAPADIRFRYRLEGFDRDWIDAGSRRVAYYTHVPPGHYRFQVLASGRDGARNERGAELDLMVAPHFWETGVFRWSAATVALALAWAGIRFISERRLKRRLADLQRQHALERERIRIARDMHDDVGTRLTEIALLTDLARRELPEADGAQDQFQRIARLTRDVTKSVREVVWATDPRNDRLDQLAEYICQHAGTFLQSSGIRLRLEADAEFPATPLGTEARHNLFLAFKEALHNAVRHSGAREIHLRLALASGAFIIEVADDGRGFDPAAVSTGGNGLRNMAARLRESGGDCEWQSQQGSGCRVRFTLPLRSGGIPDSWDGRPEGDPGTIRKT